MQVAVRAKGSDRRLSRRRHAGQCGYAPINRAGKTALFQVGGQTPRRIEAQRVAEEDTRTGLRRGGQRTASLVRLPAVVHGDRAL